MRKTPAGCLIFLLLLAVFTAKSFAGGSGLNVVVVVNQNSTNSVQLGNYYREQRNVPPQNVLRINWPGTNIEWTLSDFTTNLLNPFLSMLASRQLTNQIDYVVLSMDIPYRVSNGANRYNSTTAALFYGFKNDPNGGSCELAPGSSNAYAGSESIFRQTPPTSPNSNSFLVTMITAGDLPTAKIPVRQGATSDGTFPTQTVWLDKSLDINRNVRFTEFDNAIFNTRLRGNYSVMRTNWGDNNGVLLFFPGLVLGIQAGSYFYGLSPVPTFPPGAMADSLTSSSGTLFEDTAGAITLLRFIQSGASGSYGTVVEPCNFLQKFPDSQNYFYQSRGFSLGECYYQSLTNPYQGLVVGEPLAAPFAQPGSASWNGLSNNAVLTGTTNLSGQFTASDAQHPLHQVDLFLDGTWIQTINTISPNTGDVLNVSLNGFSTNYTIPVLPTSISLRAVASNLVSVLNTTAYQNKTQVKAIAHGDRIELQSTGPFTITGPQVAVSAGSTNSTGVLATFINASPGALSTFLDSTAQGNQKYTLTGTLASGSTLTLTVTKTNNSVVTVTVTNNGNANLLGFAQQFVNTISNTASLQGLDGLYGDDVETSTGNNAFFTLYARSGGYAAAQITAAVAPGLLLSISPSGMKTMTQNLSDLEPRNHLYITTGASNLPFSASFNSVNFPDGYHELEMVAYEGSSVHTQTRLTQQVIIQNTSLSATLTPILTGSNSTLQPTLQFAVVANTNDISSIQLFSTGGLLATVSNQNSATFSITYSNLDIGTHPFYAIVTQSSGKQYRTPTRYVGLTGVTYQGATLTGVDYPFPIQTTIAPSLLVWPATAGRNYNVQSTTNLTTAYQTRAVVMPTNSLGQWLETNTTPAQQFYRISVAP